MMLETHLKLCMTELDFPEKFFYYDNIICCVSAQIPFLGKFLFSRYGPKCSQPIRLQDFLINHISRANQ